MTVSRRPGLRGYYLLYSFQIIGLSNHVRVADDGWLGNKRQICYPSDVTDEERAYGVPYSALCREDSEQREIASRHGSSWPRPTGRGERGSLGRRRNRSNRKRGREIGSDCRRRRREWKGHRTHSSERDSRRVRRERARVHSRGDWRRQARSESMAGEAIWGWKDTVMIARYRAIMKREPSTSPSPSCDRLAEKMAAGRPPRRNWTAASGRLPGRVHLSIQSPKIQIPRQTLLSIGSTSYVDRPCSVCKLGQATSCCIWWRQVNTSNYFIDCPVTRLRPNVNGISTTWGTHRGSSVVRKVDKN